MLTTDVFKIYARFGNFFKIIHNSGKLFMWESDPREKIGHGKTIFFGGKFYSYEGGDGAREVVPSVEIIKSMITRQFCLKLRNIGYRFRGDYRAFKRENEVENPHKEIFSVFEGFEFRTILASDSILLCVDPHIFFRFNCSIGRLVEKAVPLNQLNGFSVSYLTDEQQKKRIVGYLLETLRRETNEGTSIMCRIKNYRDFVEALEPADKVFPEARPELIQELLSKLNINYDVEALQRRLSFLDSKTASRDRLLKTLEVVRTLQSEVFPLEFGEFQVRLEAEPTVIKS